VTNQCVLIVDDDEEVGQSLAMAAESIAGVRTVIAPHGPAALRLLEANGLRIDALITDLNLPHLDGLELLRKIRSLPGYARLPVLLITADPKALPRNGYTVEGPDVVLEKPFSCMEVSRVLEQMLP
jgi:two-component system, chemotaxis family, chemotaxis protein CheY